MSRQDEDEIFAAYSLAMRTVADLQKMCGDQDACITRLRSEVERLRGLLAACADDLEAELKATYGGMQDGYPDISRKFKRDMEPVYKARAALKETGK